MNLSLLSLNDLMISHPYLLTAGLLTAVALAGLVNKKILGNNNRLPYPPGPRGYPIIGSLLSMPVKQAWTVYKEWAYVYGDMVYFEVLGQPFLILDSEERINELLDKRSANYSNRPRMPMIVELMGWDYNLGLLSYGERWRRLRREFHRFFNPKAVPDYHPIQEQEAHALLRRLLVTPDNFLSHVRIFFGALVMRISYGIEIEDQTNPYIVAAEAALSGFHEAGIPGRFWVDFFPALKYVPSWMPGADFKRKAAYWSSLNDVTQEKPYRHVLENTRQGIAVSSIATQMIDELPSKDDPEREEEERIARNIAATGFLSGADTTLSAGKTFFLAMAMYPDVQKKAQAELDAILEHSRLPSFEDRARLPYLNAVMKEIIRWLNVVPLGIYHTSAEDDEYDGYFIPKGTIVMANVWSILHNPDIYEDPFVFNPERFLKDGQLNPEIPQPEAVAFGSGRRVCPGKYLSEDALYIVIATVLSTFSITQSLDESGNPIELTTEVTGNIVCNPAPFQCTIKPRSTAAEGLISDSQNLYK